MFDPMRPRMRGQLPTRFGPENEPAPLDPRLLPWQRGQHPPGIHNIPKAPPPAGTVMPWDELQRSSRLGKLCTIPPLAAPGFQVRAVDIALGEPEMIVVYAQPSLAFTRRTQNQASMPVNLLVQGGTGGAVLGAAATVNFNQTYLLTPRGLALQFEASSLSVDVVLTGGPVADPFEFAVTSGPGRIRPWFSTLSGQVPLGTAGGPTGLVADIPAFAQRVLYRQDDVTGAAADALTLAFLAPDGTVCGRVGGTAVAGQGGQLVPIPQNADRIRIDVTLGPTTVALNVSFGWEHVT